MKKLFRWKIWRWILLFLVVVLFVLVHFLAPRLIIGKRPQKSGYPSINEVTTDIDTVMITTPDGFNLYGIWTNSNLDTVKGTVLFVHGIGSCKDYYIPRTEWLANLGYQSFILDLRAHGMSEGDYITYGFNEVADISSFVDELETSYSLVNLGVWGQSLGGAISLQVLARDKRFNFGIVESTYGTFDQVVHDYSKRIFGVPLGFINDYVIWRAQSIASFDKSGIHPVDACKEIDQPVLLVHGAEDDRISVDYAYTNFEALKSSEKELFLVKGANHINVWEKGGTAYEKKCIQFLTQQSLRFK